MNRRHFLTSTAAASSMIFASSPIILGLTRKSGLEKPILGIGDHKYECDHAWAKLPADLTWQTSHGICFDDSGLAYIIMSGSGKDAVATIHVFDPSGKYVRSMGKDFHPGGHGIDVRKEGSDEFLYVCDTAHRSVIKMNLKGDVVWKKGFPEESGVYKESSGADGKVKRPAFVPTNVAFLDDGGFYIGDGYGSSYMHRYSPDGKWMKTFGGPGKLRTPHGQWVDKRTGASKLLIADRENGRLLATTLDGDTLGENKGFLRPCNVDFHGDLAVVAELTGRVALLDKDNKVITYLGDDSKRITDDKKLAIRSNPKEWQDGKFVHPHDAAFDKAGNIFVIEWVSTGRITKLKKV